MLDTIDRFRGCLLGLAVGDALGTTVEFAPRGSFTPLTDMVGGGPFRLAAGQWTDDTSMALCLASSLVERNAFDLRDQIDRYCRWHEEGYWSSNGRCFDIGSTIRSALRTYRDTGNPRAGIDDPRAAGNGCIMRLAPVPMFFFPDAAAAIERSGESCLTTHAATECIDSARLLAAVIVDALAGHPKPYVSRPREDMPMVSPRLRAIASAAYVGKRDSDIKGTGYVVDCLEAALWCFANTESFKDAVLM